MALPGTTTTTPTALAGRSGRNGVTMDWDKLRVFHAVAEAGSFTHAGDTLNLSQSAVSRQISALEEALQVPLFHRHARGLILTEQGESLNRTVREVFAKLAMTEALLTESKEKPAGRLKVTTTVGFGATWLAPRVHAFLDQYPDVTMSLILDDSDLDLAMREADVAIRMHPPKQPDLVQRHLIAMEWHVCASAEYLRRHGTPQKPEDLDGHRIVLFGDYRPPVAEMNWLAEIGRRPGNPRRPLLEVNSVQAMVMAVRSGVGIAALPDYMAAEEEAHGLVRILPDVKAPKVDVYFVYPEELRTSKRVAVFRDFLLARLAQRG
jgi:DNA-binding transcriptional LysR family regulator